MKKISVLIPCYNEEENVGPISDAVIDSARAAITARELIKAHVLNNANLPTKETMEDLADMLGAELIQVIGHYGVLFKKKDKKSHYEFIKD